MSSVLIIDDDEVDFLIQSEIIREAGFATKVIHKNSAITALQYLESIFHQKDEWPALIFLDINMPHMSGFGFIDAYLKFPDITSKTTKIYIISSSSSLRDVNKSKEYTVINGYITKPLTLTGVQKILNTDSQSSEDVLEE